MRRTTITGMVAGTVLAAALAAVPALASSTDAAPPRPPGSTGDAQMPVVHSAAIDTPVDQVSDATSPATTSTPRPAPTPLTADQQGLVDDYLAVHLGRADALAAVAQRWHQFATAHPDVAAEVVKISAMAPTDRAAELKSWSAAHPAQAAELKAWRQQIRQDRRDRRQDRRERRQERRADRPDGAASSGAPSSGAPSSDDGVFLTPSA